MIQGRKQVRYILYKYRVRFIFCGSGLRANGSVLLLDGSGLSVYMNPFYLYLGTEYSYIGSGSSLYGSKIHLNGSGSSFLDPELDPYRENIDLTEIKFVKNVLKVDRKDD